MAKYIKLYCDILDDPRMGSLSDHEWRNVITGMFDNPDLVYEDTDASYTNYAKYLNSVHWKNTRKKKLIQTEFRCEKCGSREKLQVHHLTYENIGAEYLEDLQVLCASCHTKVHNKEGINA